MAGTCAFRLRRQLVDSLGDHLAPTPVTYGEPAPADQRAEHVWVGVARRAGVESDHDPVALQAGRRARDETVDIELVVEVRSARTPRESEARADELCTTVEEWLADNPTIPDHEGTGVAGLLWCVVAEMEADTAEIGTTGPVTQVVYTLRARARIR
jgi:hypothetical protein